MVWVALRLMLQGTEVIQENVKQFQVALLARFLGATYWIYYTVMDPVEFGWSSARERKWAKLASQSGRCRYCEPVVEIHFAISSRALDDMEIMVFRAFLRP
jgi:hypothetical protein